MNFTHFDGDSVQKLVRIQSERNYEIVFSTSGGYTGTLRLDYIVLSGVFASQRGV